MMPCIQIEEIDLFWRDTRINLDGPDANKADYGGPLVVFLHSTRKRTLKIYTARTEELCGYGPCKDSGALLQFGCP